MTLEKTAKPKRTRKPKPQPHDKHLCHIHNSCIDNYRESIHEHVCRSLETTEHTDSNYYCLFHLPTKEKDIAKFEEEFQKRLHEHDDAIVKIKTKLDKKAEPKHKQDTSYDFRFVWFPSEVYVCDFNFKVFANFWRATFNDVAFIDTIFSDNAYFGSATFDGDLYALSVKFNGGADFSFSTFNGDAIFNNSMIIGNAGFLSATFNGEANFKSVTVNGNASFTQATIRGNANFHWATFSSYGYFNSVTFGGSADFYSATFNGNADFSSATFEEKSQAVFNQTKFNKEVDFQYATIRCYAAFGGNHDNRVFLGKDTLLNLRHVSIDDAKKISFHTVRLEPGWFVDQKDTAQFVFSDCKWRYADGKSLKVKTEIENLRQREVSGNPNEILTKACWQLADNHEESKSLGKASMFRKFANESKRLGTPWYKQPFTLHWWYYAVSFYGESWSWSLGVLLCLIFVVFPFIYTQTDFQVSPKSIPLEVIVVTRCDQLVENSKFVCSEIRQGGLNFWSEAIPYSLTSSTFQDVEYRKPISVWAEFWTILEKIFAPLQAALLALAIRRKFMR